MTQHKCGTCRYFEEGGFAGSGRCGHPLRKNIQHMVLVRKSELACRTDWAADLWEPKEGTEPVSISSAPRAEPDRGTDGVKRQYTDRVTAVSVTGTPHTTGEQPSVADRQAAQVVPATSSDAASSERTTPDRDVLGEPRRSWADPGRAEVKPVSNVRPAERSNTAEAQQTTTSERSSITEPGLDLDSLTRREPSREPGRNAPVVDTKDERSVSTPSFSPSSQPPISPRRPISEHGSVPRLTDRPMPGSERFEQRREPAAPSRPTRRAELERDEPQTPSFGSPPATPAERGELPQGRSGWTEPFSVAQPAPVNVPAPPRSEPVRDEHVHAAQPALPARIPGSVNQTALRECCATCRDFRPSEGGDRGWCNNQYAFDHRQMVDRNELACRGTIGSWWIASDDWWLQRADISHHGRPTPIVDDLLRQLLDSRMSAARRRSGRG